MFCLIHRFGRFVCDLLPIFVHTASPAWLPQCLEINPEGYDWRIIPGIITLLSIIRYSFIRQHSSEKHTMELFDVLKYAQNAAALQLTFSFPVIQISLELSTNKSFVHMMAAQPAGWQPAIAWNNSVPFHIHALPGLPELPCAVDNSISNK